MGFRNFIDEFFGGGRQRGFEDLQRALEQARTQATGALQKGEQFFEPFRGSGTQALSRLQQIFGEAPQDVVSRIEGGFQQTPGFQFQKQQAQEALQNQLAAAGLTGSGEALRRSSQLASNLAQQAEQQHLANVLGVRGGQISGLQNIFGTGFGAAGQEAGLQRNIADVLGQFGGQIGQAQFGQDVARAQGLSSLLGGVGQAAGFLGGSLFQHLLGGAPSGGFNLEDMLAASHGFPGSTPQAGGLTFMPGV